MTVLVDSSLSWYHWVVIWALKAGPIPRHVAFIMDGNRRFAQKAHITRAEGHSRGSDRLAEILQCCQEIGIRELTAYTFSIENFKRSREEVDTLFEMSRKKFQGFLEDVPKLNERGIRIMVFGKMDLLPVDLQQIMAKVMVLTKQNTNIVLNLAYPYTSREEITRSIRTIAEGCAQGHLKPNDIDEQLLSSCMYTRHCSEPDLLVRTSGEVRLSDFLLWQSTSTILFFTGTLWPEINVVWYLLGMVFYYQRNHWFRGSIQKEMKQHDDQKCGFRREARVRKFVQRIEHSDNKNRARLANKC